MPEADNKVTASQEPDAAGRFLAEVRKRAESMAQPDGERDLFAFAADVERKVGMLPGTLTRRGGVGIDVWTASSRRGQPRYRVWVERGENGHLSAYGANNFEAVPRLLEAVEAARSAHPEFEGCCMTCREPCTCIEDAYAACGFPESLTADHALAIGKAWADCTHGNEPWPCQEWRDITAALTRKATDEH